MHATTVLYLDSVVAAALVKLEALVAGSKFFLVWCKTCFFLPKDFPPKPALMHVIWNKKVP